MPSISVHSDAIACLRHFDVTEGKTDRTFDPGGTLTRGQLASFLTRTLDAAGVALPAATRSFFTDTAGSPHEEAIDRLASAGIVPTSSSTFGLHRRVDRAEMARRTAAALRFAGLQRAEKAADARVRVVLASPATVDRLCAQAGLNTAGIYSCWNGRVAAINADRWFSGVTHVRDMALYRTYVINHEVGHGLGQGHRSCPGSGRLAPVMMQLSKSTYGCMPNGLPYP